MIKPPLINGLSNEIKLNFGKLSVIVYAVSESPFNGRRFYSKGIWPVFSIIIPIKMCVYYKIWLHPLLRYLAASKATDRSGMPRKLVNFPHNSKCMSLRIFIPPRFPIFNTQIIIALMMWSNFTDIFAKTIVKDDRNSFFYRFRTQGIQVIFEVDT